MKSLLFLADTNIRKIWFQRNVPISLLDIEMDITKLVYTYRKTNSWNHNIPYENQSVWVPFITDGLIMNVQHKKIYILTKNYSRHC